MHPQQKLYVVTRQDLRPGVQAVQAGHALVGFSFTYPDFCKRWYEESNYLCYLAVRDESELLSLVEKAKSKGLKFFSFQEPDLDFQLTALCLEPTLEVTEFCKGLNLALREFQGK